MKCPCGLDSTFELCCGPYLAGKRHPDTAEQLMRSRYTAYTRADIEYIKKTMVNGSKKDFDEVGTRQWAEGSKWKGLKIQDTKKGGPSDSTGLVEFTATYEREGVGLDHHEVATFRKTKEGQWLFVDGDAHEHKEGEGHHDTPQPATVVREGSKVGRNDPCPCQSGKKYKKCCEATA